MSPHAEHLTRDLLRKALHLKALCDHEPGVVPFGLARAKRDVGDAAVALEAELAKPVETIIQPWSPWTPGNSHKPGGAF